MVTIIFSNQRGSKMHQVQNLLKKIGYIEAEIEIQKQILYSIPSDRKEEIEEVITKIAKSKDEIEKIREEIKIIDPEEYKLLTKIDEAVASFKSTIKTRNIISVVSKAEDANCSVSYKDGRVIQCLVKACDDEGNWIVITVSGELKIIPPSKVH